MLVKSRRNGLWFPKKECFLLDQELNQIRFVKVIMKAKCIPGFSDVLFSLLKGHLLSNGI